MYTVVLVIDIILAVCLCALVLLQRSEGGALGGLGGGTAATSFMTGRSVGNMLTRLTAILAFCFVVTTLTLGILAKRDLQRTSIVTTTVPVEAPVQE